MNEKTAVETKQRYEEPVLSEYGNISQITQAASNIPTAVSDNNPAGPNFKTR